MRTFIVDAVEASCLMVFLAGIALLTHAGAGLALG